MGDFGVRKIKDAQDRSAMYASALNDIQAFETMLEEDLFEHDVIHIGAEQELCIVDKSMNPSLSALKILDQIDDEHYTNELALFNLEINLDPHPLTGNCFSNIESELIHLLKKGSDVAARNDDFLIQAGILPTLKFRDLQFDKMTPIARYQTLSESLAKLRGSQFDVHLQGVDDLIMSLNTVLFEACNTSFQLHLQIKPDEFVNKHNWAQMISGPVLATCVNSPMLFGNELWSETRIALFKQSLDTRSPYKYLRKKVPRVYFGNNWLEKSPVELWKNDLMRFPLIVATDNLRDSKETLAKGEIPDLRAVRLHNGTTYTWNRLCYGYSKKKPHLRIECRYLPSGPSTIDEIANFAFWIGLMNATPPEGFEFWKNIEFKEAKNNFIKAAQNGLSSVFRWYGKNIPAKKLLLEHLIPLSREGLEGLGVSEKDIHRYLQIINSRVEKEITGADWIIANYRNLSAKYGGDIAQREIVAQTLEYQRKNVPVHQWKDLIPFVNISSYHDIKVETYMSTDIHSVSEDSSIDLAKNILAWNDIHHLPVEDENGDLTGLITDGILNRINGKKKSKEYLVKDIMIKNPITVNAHDPITKAEYLLQDKGLSGVPVVFNKKLVGILTMRDMS